MRLLHFEAVIQTGDGSLNLIRKITPYVAFVLAVAALRFFFELRYFWYINPDDAFVLNVGFGIGAIILSVIFLFFPIRVLGGVVALVVMLFPQAIPTMALQLNSGFLVFSLGVTLLFVGSIELRRRSQQINNNE